MTRPGNHPREVQPQALAFSLVALLVPVCGTLVLPERLVEFGALLWLCALVPTLVLAYHQAWHGVAMALALGLSTLTASQLLAARLGRPVPELLGGVVMAYVLLSLGIGWLADLMHRDRDEVQDMAFTDTLTHLPNRRHAQVFLDNEFAAAQRGRLLCVVLFDLDNFKSYNDRYGHQAGDRALRSFARILTDTTRRMNLAARYGGEEFVAILAGTDAEGGVVFAERVRADLQELAVGEPRLTVSAGVAAYEPSMRSPDELLAAADHALYEAKRKGRNRTTLYEGASSDPQ